MAKRVFLIVLDSFGIGAEPDADLFGDEGTNTLKACSNSDYLMIPNMTRLGLLDIDGVKEWSSDLKAKMMKIDSSVDSRFASFARLREKSMGKDTTIGHWEIAGIVSDNPLPTFPDGFPKETIEEFMKLTGRGVLCNKPYSGTKVINDYGDEHVKTGDLIVYTSADSVFQIAAHEDVVPVEQLYEYCRIARKLLTGNTGVGRVIARPFIGESSNYVRTPKRHDFSLEPPKDTMLDILKNNGYDVYSVGKIYDIFASKGITKYVYTSNNEEGINKTLEYMKEDFNGLCFTNLVDFDMVYGHRRDVDGYAKALTYFDSKLPDLISGLKEDDVLMITADHGCDPSYTKTTDHTREYIPLLIYDPKMSSTNYGTRSSFSDIGATVLKMLSINGNISGEALI